MLHRGIALTVAVLSALAFCTGAGAQSLEIITNANLKAYTASELAHGAPSIPVTSRALYREALQLLREGKKEEAVRKLELSANITGDYAAPLFTLARIKILSASPDFLPYLIDGCKRVIVSYPSQAVFAANAAAFLIFTVVGALLATLVALLVKYWQLIDHKIVEAFGDRFTFPPARWIIGIICVALVLMRLGFALYIAILLVALWSFLNRREKAAVLSLVILLSAASVLARSSNMLAPAIDPRSVTNRLALVNRRGADEDCIARIRAIEGKAYRTDRSFALGTMMYRIGHYPDAQAYLLESVSLSDLSASAFVNLGNVYFMQGDYDKALAGYQSAVELDSASAVANYNIGQAYIKKMLFAQSGDWLERANMLGIDAFRSAHPAIGLRNSPVYESGFESGELRSIAALEGGARRKILIGEMLGPYLLFPFPWLWLLFAASLCAAMILARKLPLTWHVERCENCGSATCAACGNMQTGIRLCRDCAAVIKDLGSVKVMEALLRTRRQRVASARQRSHRRRTLFFPGASHLYYGRTAPGVALSLVGAGAVAILVWKGAYFKDPGAMNTVQPLWMMLFPLGALCAAYIASFRVKAPQEPRNFRVFPPEMRLQERGIVKEQEQPKAAAAADPGTEPSSSGPTAVGAKAGARAATGQTKPPAREEALVGGIEKGSKWH
ncbi:MAG: tetratricopeptide repeat protein [Candidatus Krumholzibacteria bacterium]|nr:tetratricopeptide repeat protein [Candidatus Krumholzibacteria bacterium]